MRPKVRFETAAYYNSKEDHRAVTGCCNEDNELWARESAEAHGNLAQSLLDMVLVQSRLKVHIVRFELWFALFKFIHGFSEDSTRDSLPPTLRRELREVVIPL